MAAGDPTDAQPPPLGVAVPPGTTELGIDIIKVDRIRDDAREVRRRGSRTAS